MSRGQSPANLEKKQGHIGCWLWGSVLPAGAQGQCGTGTGSQLSHFLKAQPVCPPTHHPTGCRHEAALPGALGGGIFHADTPPHMQVQLQRQAESLPAFLLRVPPHLHARHRCPHNLEVNHVSEPLGRARVCPGLVLFTCHEPGIIHQVIPTGRDRPVTLSHSLHVRLSVGGG